MEPLSYLQRGGIFVVSVIVPVFNAEGYFKNCMDALLAQDFLDIEIILINDGSIDNTKTICDIYGKNHDNITVIHQKNSGVSSARNVGIHLAKGEYIAFVDSDDFMIPNYISSLFEAFSEESDLSVCGIKAVKNGIPQEPVHMLNGTFSTKDFLRLAFLGDVHPLAAFSTPTNKLLKTSIIKDANLLFDTRFSYGEDTLFMLNYLAKAKTISLTNSTYYKVNVQTNSLSSSFLTPDKLKFYSDMKPLLLSLCAQYELFTQDDIVAISRYLLDVWFARARDIFSGAKSKSDLICSLSALAKTNFVQKADITAARGNALKYRLLSGFIHSHSGHLIWLWFVLATKLKW